MTAHAARRLIELVERVATPLALGGPLRPVRPIGARLTAELAPLAPELAASDTAALRARRGDVWRALFPCDEEPPLSPDCARLLAALNDLLQCVNPAFDGLLGDRRVTELAKQVERVVASVGPPHTLADALARHATLAGLARLARHDTTITWWTGKAVFVGATPPARLRAWPELRRVRERSTTAPLFALAEGGLLPVPRYHALISALLARSPLTELSLADVVIPRFQLSASLASIVATPLGRAIVQRLVDASTPGVQTAWEAAAKKSEAGRELAATTKL